MKSSQILINKFKTQAKDSKAWRLPLAIGIYINGEKIVGSFSYNTSTPHDPQENVEIDDYEFSEDLATFPVYDIDYDESSFTFKCRFALDDRPSKNVVTLREAMLIDFDLNDFETFYIELYGKKYEIIADGAEFINEQLEDEKTYTQFIYISTLPAIDLDNTSWADYHANEAWKAEQQYIKDITAADYYDDMHESTEFHQYEIKFLTRNSTGNPDMMQIDATTVEDAIKSFNEEFHADFPRDSLVEIISIKCDGKPISKSIVDAMNTSYLEECDGGAAGGDAGGGIASADAGGAEAAVDAPSVDNSGIKVNDVLGNCDHHKNGFMGTDCFHVPSKVAVPLYRWSGAAYGGSKRKNKKKKTAYEQGMKTVVSMFEAENPKVWTYREWMLEAEPTLNDYGYEFRTYVDDMKFAAQLKSRIPVDMVYFKPDDENGCDSCMFIDFTSREEAVKFAIKRNHDYFTMAQYTQSEYFDISQDRYNEWYKEYEHQCKKNDQSIKTNGIAEYNDGPYTQWECAIYETEIPLTEGKDENS